MGAIRRGFACAFVLAAFFASFNSKYITALLLLFIAINVHLSAIFCLPFIFVNKYRSSIKSFLLFLTLSFLLGYLFNNYYDKLISLNSDLLIYQKFIAYFDSGFELNVGQNKSQRNHNRTRCGCKAKRIRESSKRLISFKKRTCEVVQS